MAERRVSRWYFGGLASCGAACCTHPLDLLKVTGTGGWRAAAGTGSEGPVLRGRGAALRGQGAAVGGRICRAGCEGPGGGWLWGRL